MLRNPLKLEERTMRSCQTSGFQRTSYQDLGKHVWHFSGYDFFLRIMAVLLCWCTSRPVQDCFEIEKHILRALAIGLGLSEDYFTNVHTKPDNQLRLLHYPRHVEEVKNALFPAYRLIISVSARALVNEEISRIDAHSDFNHCKPRLIRIKVSILICYKLLLQDDIGGLEVQNPKSREFFVSFLTYNLRVYERPLFLASLSCSWFPAS